MHVATRKRLGDSAQAMDETETELSAQLSHPDLVRGLGLVPATLSRWQHRYGAALAAEEATHRRTEALHEIEALVSNLLQMGAFLYVGVLLFDGSATAGMLMSVYFLMSNALHPFSQLMTCLGELGGRRHRLGPAAPGHAAGCGARAAAARPDRTGGAAAGQRRLPSAGAPGCRSSAASRCICRPVRSAPSRAPTGWARARCCA